jgi:hypothetical protein
MGKADCLNQDAKKMLAKIHPISIEMYARRIRKERVLLIIL